MNTNYKLYLDDERNPKTKGPWIIARSYDEFVRIIEEKGLPDSISFDNDLGENKPEGYDCAKWMVNIKRFDLRNVKINVHSANPKAPDNIYKLIDNWNEMVEKHGTDYLPDVEFEKMKLKKLYRPVSQAELDLILESGMKKFPPRLAQQPIFYPVDNIEYAREINIKWNIPAYGSGFIMEFEVEESFLQKYPLQNVGGQIHNEYWIPAEDLEEFNSKIINEIKIIE